MTRHLLILAFALAGAPALWAEEKKPAQESTLKAGHSHQGEAFNEGPRQAAVRIAGTGKVSIPIQTGWDQGQEFFNQGVGQLHGFWYYEAERTFREIAAHDPKCAMAYWGMALANWENEKRAKVFIKKAVELKDSASEHNRLFIEAQANYLDGDPKDSKKRKQELINQLENIIQEYPDDIEARTFLCLRLWQFSRGGLPIHSYQSVDAMLQQILAANPMHPAHHFRIHLWDGKKARIALDSAAKLGHTAPGIAHMWHMPGHIYSKLKRYHDSAWQQEASARVDHAHMMRDRVLPDQIHNFAHNNEWLTRNLNHLGRANDAVSLARNMIELPRHPKNNTLAKPGKPSEYGKRGSARYGRMRLLETLLRYEMWEEIIRASQTVYLEPTTIPEEQAKRLAAVGTAHFALGQAEKGTETLAKLNELKQRLEDMKLEAEAKAGEDALAAEKNDKETKKAKADAVKPFDGRIKTLNQYLAELLACQAVVDEDADEFKKQIGKAGKMSREHKSQLYLKVGNKEEAEKLASQSARTEGQVQPLANYVDILWRSGKEKEAVEQFKKLRNISAHIDIERAVFQRLAPVAKKLELPEDWRIEFQSAGDVGDRPSLDTLGPFRWIPTPATQWELTDGQGKKHTLADYTGRPVIVIFYLGKGCAHCIEQLGVFAPKTEEFKQAGIDLIAISTDDVGGLRETVQQNKTGSPFPFPLISDASLNVFKQYRAYDDFEQQPLHGTFLIDRQGLVRWQDISYEPFTQADFLLRESKRLLAQDPPQVTQR